MFGVSIAAPVGPIGVLCIQRTLARGRRSGFVSGLGAASADAVYAAVAGFGLTALAGLLLDYRTGIRIGGGLLLLAIGVRTAVRAPAEVAAGAPHETAAAAGEDAVAAAASAEVAAASTAARGLAGDFGSTFLLTLANPVTVLAFVGLFAGLALGPGDTYADAATVVVGVFLGSALWWFVLSTAVSLVRGRFTRRSRRWVNRLSGLVVAGFGLVVLWQVW